MPKPTTKKRVFIGVSGLTHDLLCELRAQARRNNRSLSGELRHILQAHLSGVSIDTPMTQNQKTTWNT